MGFQRRKSSVGTNDELCTRLSHKYPTSVCARFDMKECGEWLKHYGFNEEGCCFLVQGRDKIWYETNPCKEEISQRMSMATDNRRNPPKSTVNPSGKSNPKSGICS